MRLLSQRSIAVMCSEALWDRSLRTVVCFKAPRDRSVRTVMCSESLPQEGPIPAAEAAMLKVTEGASIAGDLGHFNGMLTLWRMRQNTKVTRVAHSSMTLHLVKKCQKTKVAEGPSRNLRVTLLSSFTVALIAITSLCLQ